jgi:hypothetical protein
MSGPIFQSEREVDSNERRSKMNDYILKIANMRNKGKFALTFVAVILFIFAFGYGSAHGQVFQITVPMSGAEEVPPVATPGTGLGTLTVDTVSGSISGTVTFSGLTSPTTAGHIHAGAVGVNGPVIIPLVGGVGVTAGTMLLPNAVLLPDQLAALMTNGLYINIHTTANLNGEIRGQILFTSASQAGSLYQAPLVEVVSGNFDPARAGDELAGLSKDGRIFISLDLVTWVEIPGRFISLIKGDFNGDGVDDIGGLSEDGETFVFTTDFVLSFTEIPFPEKWE